MASTSLSTDLKGYFVVNLVIDHHNYNSVKLLILPNLCADVLIGHDIMKQHSCVDVSFGGPKSPLFICSLFPAKVEPPYLFTNFTSDCKPIATKSRRFSDQDQKFIE